MRSIDLNADTGEANTAEWRAVEDGVLSYISSANIACGGHAGDDDSMRRTIKIAKSHNINIGAHPAYPDKANFGRKSMTLGTDISPRELQGQLSKQITRLVEIAAEELCSVNYVKPHGALYNDAVFNRDLAMRLAETVASLDSRLWLMGAPKSETEMAAKAFGLNFIAEGFVDRRYTEDGHLLSRSQPGAVIEDQDLRCAQAISLLRDGQVETNEGGSITIDVDTLCLHSDSPGADRTAKIIRTAIEQKGAEIRAFIHAG